MRPERRLPTLLSIVLLLLVASGSPAGGDELAATLVLRGGTLWTGVEQGTRPGAVAMLGERIVGVGDDEEIAAMIGPDTRVVDLDGAMALPGFIDTHVHFSSAARLLLGVNLLDVADEESFVRAVREAHERMPEGAWLVGGDWSAYQRWPKGADRPLEGEIDLFEPHRRMLEGVAPGRAMFLSRFDRQVWFASPAALEAAGIDASTPDPAGGRFGRDPETGELTGTLEGTAIRRVRAAVPPPSWEQRLAESRAALRRIRENGVTTVHDISSPEQLRVYQELLDRGELTVRVHYRPTLDQYRRIADVGIMAGFGDPWIKLGAVKGFVDGIMGNSTALFDEPYDHRPDSRGRLRDMMFPAGNMQRLLNEADAAGLQVTVHAIGDAANRMLLDMYEETVAENGERDRRFRVVHAQVMRAADIRRFGELGLVAEVQPYHAIDDMRWMEQRIGDRARGAYAFESLRQAGATLAFGSDWPGTNAAWYPISPLLGIYAATTRQTLDGNPEGGWYPEERLGVEEALRAYTVNNAWAGYEEEEKGTLEAGKLADVTVVDRDLLTVPAAEIKDAEVLYTIVGGEVVWSHGGAER